MVASVPGAPAKRWAREYETIYILRPNVTTEGAAKVAQRVKDVVDKTGGKFVKVDTWGKRKLAYPIAKHSRGTFIFMHLAGYNDMVAELERNLRLLDEVIRYQTIRVGDPMELATVSADPEEIEFAEIEGGEEEEELTRAQQLGLQPIRSRHDEDKPRDKDEAKADAEGEAKADEPKAEAAAEAKAEAKADEAKTEAKSGEEE